MPQLTVFSINPFRGPVSFKLFCPRIPYHLSNLFHFPWKSGHLWPLWARSAIRQASALCRSRSSGKTCRIPGSRAI